MVDLPQSWTHPTTHQLINLTKFHDIMVKTVDCLVIAKFWLTSKFLAYPLNTFFSMRISAVSQHAEWDFNKIENTFN